LDDYDNADFFLNEYEQSQGQQSTAASKLQIKLNNLINSHKAPIKLYDDIVICSTTIYAAITLTNLPD
jgi:hypothetical protein